MNHILPGPVLIVAPHPDDEVLGCGGTIARLTTIGIPTHVCIVTKGRPPQFDPAQVDRVAGEALIAHNQLQVTETHWLDLPAAALDQVPHRELNAALSALVARVRPATMLIPFAGDVHLDHQLVARSCLVAARPRSLDAPALVMAYETLSETNWGAPTIDPGFTPTCFIDVTATLNRKLQAFAAFTSQVRDFPDERSLETIRALAMLRGSTVFRPAAEAFHVIRDVR